MRLALIDLGSNSARMYLLCIEPDGTVRYLSKDRVMTRLSEGMGPEKQLKEIPMRRTIAVLRGFAEKIRQADANALAVATAAVRAAQNGAAFCAAVEAETGIRLRVITGKQEAALDFAGVMSGLPEIADCLITDTGGGSTELILVKNRQITAKTSLPFGAVSLFEAYPPDRALPGNALRQAAHRLSRAFAETGFLAGAGKLPIVGLGGSVCSLFPADQNLFCTNPAGDLNGYCLARGRVTELLRRLASLSPTERIGAAIEPGRADTVCHGILPTAVLMERLCSPGLILSSAGLREGLLAKIMENGPEYNMKNVELFLLDSV